MKVQKMLAIVIAMTLVISCVPVTNLYADSISKEAAACKELGVLIGADSSGVTTQYLAQTPKRIQAFIIFLRLKGLYDEATNFDSNANFSDAGTSLWAKNYMAYAKSKPELGWVGYPDGTFAPNKEMDGKSFYKVMLETLGYKQNVDFTYNETLTFAEQIGLAKSASSITAIKSFTVNDVAKAIYSTLNTKPKGSDKKLISLMVENQLVASDKAIAAGFSLDTKEVKVTGFKNITNNKLEVEFDQDITVQKADIEITELGGSSRLSVLSVSSQKNMTTIITTEAKPFKAYEITLNTVVPVNSMVIRNYKTKYVGFPKDVVKPTVISKPEPISSNEIQINFSEELDRSEAENLSNYMIERDISILSAQLSESGKTVILRTTEQYPDSFYKITVQGVSDIAGNEMDKYSNYFDGLPKDTQEPYIQSVQSETSKTVIVTFNEKLDRASAENTGNYAIDNNMSVYNAVLDENGKAVHLTTSAQKAGSLYKLTVQNVSDTSGNILYKKEFRFSGDSSKPTASVVALSNNEIMVKFSEKVDKISAEDPDNYSIDKKLQVLKVILDGSGKTATLITDSQTAHELYTITISGVTDAWGNAVATLTTKFGGIPADNKELSFTVTSKASSIIVTFNKRVDKESAEDVFNYILDGDLGYACKATLDTDATSKIVTLVTAPQISGKLYSLTIRDVEDISGNVIATDEKIAKRKFAGIDSGNSTSTGSLNLESVVTVNVNTFDLMFSNDLTKDELDDLSINVAVDEDYSGSLPSGIISYKYFLGNKKTVRVQYKTNSSNNPELFESGKIYEAKVTGPGRLNTSDNSNIKQFAGTSILNEAPRLESAEAINSTAIKVKFSEPVKGISSSQFSISGGISIGSVSVGSDEIVDEAIIFVNKNTTLKDGTDYKIYPKSGIKDAAGLVSVQTDSSGNGYITFEGTSESNEAPVVSDLRVIDNCTLELEFNEPIKYASAGAFSIKRLSGSGSTQYIVSKLELSDDKTLVKIYYNSRYATFNDGNEYELSISSAITDLQGLAIDSDNRKLDFQGVDDLPEALEIIAYTISENNKEITLVTNRQLDVDQLSLDSFVLSGAGYNKSSFDELELGDNSIKITLHNALNSNDILTIDITADGRSDIIDKNKQKLETEQIKVTTN